jgi:predicted Zn-dependent protease
MSMARSPKRMTLLLALAAVGVAGGIAAQSLALADTKKPDKPQTRITQTISQATYKQMEIAQKAFEAKDYKGAEADLDVLKAKQDKLNDFERATLYNLYAAVYRSEDDNKRAVAAYVQVLKQDNLPEGLRDNALFSLAQTLFLMEDYKKSIQVMDKWFALATDPQPDAYILQAQAYYQLQQYEQAKAPILKALAIAKQRQQPFKENWLGLLRALYYELKDYGNATKVMEVLVATYPKDTYFLQLSGLYGLQGDQKKQAELMHAAYVGGYVSQSSDVLNVARLYMAQEAPQRAVDLLKARLRDKTLEINVENLQLLAQALSLSRDTDEAIPVLSKLAQMSGESKHYNYLGQAYSQQGSWAKAADAYDQALKAKDVANADSLHMSLGTALYNDGKRADECGFPPAAATGRGRGRRRRGAMLRVRPSGRLLAVLALMPWAAHAVAGGLGRGRQPLPVGHRKRRRRAVRPRRRRAAGTEAAAAASAHHLALRRAPQSHHAPQGVPSRRRLRRRQRHAGVRRAERHRGRGRHAGPCRHLPAPAP